MRDDARDRELKWRAALGIAAMCFAAGLLAWAAHGRGYRTGFLDGNDAGHRAVFDQLCRASGGKPATLMTDAAPWRCLLPEDRR